MNLNTKRFLAVGLPLTVVAATGIAVAQWTASGSGTGRAQAGQPVAPTSISVADATVSDVLTPGNTGDVLFQLHNSNDYPIDVTVTKPAGAAAAVLPANCVVSYTIPASTVVHVDANSDSALTTLPAAASMGNADQTCAGASFSIPLALSGVSTVS